VRISADGIVYVCDRRNDRIQLFTKQGKFLKEFLLHRETRGYGSVWIVNFSRDPQQKYLLVGDGVNQRIWVIDRRTGLEKSSFGKGYLHTVYQAGLDSHGNIIPAMSASPSPARLCWAMARLFRNLFCSSLKTLPSPSLISAFSSIGYSRRFFRTSAATSARFSILCAELSERFRFMVANGIFRAATEFRPLSRAQRPIKTTQLGLSMSNQGSKWVRRHVSTVLTFGAWLPVRQRTRFMYAMSSSRSPHSANGK
jgi:hypothetical protein